MLVVRADPARREVAEAVAERIVDGALGDDHDVVRPPAPPAPDDLGWLDAALAGVEDHFARLSLDEAGAAITSVLAELDRRGVPTGRRGALVELFLVAARVAAARGDEAAERAAIRAAVAVAPELRVDQDRHPPAVADRVEVERAALENCAIRLVLEPEDARVAVDGEPAGAPPTSLPCGRHWLGISAAGHAARVVAVELAIDSVGPTPVTLELEPAAALGELGAPFSPMPPLAIEGARALDRTLWILDVALDDGHLEVRLGDRSVTASPTATPDEIVALLRAPIAAPDDDTVANIVGVSVGAAALVAAIVTTAILASMPSAPTGFELRGHVLP